MIITKTEQFHKKFLYDLSNIVIFKKEYLESIKKWDREKKLKTIGFRNQQTRSVKFLGSYFNKEFGRSVTDIDVRQILDTVSDERLYKRIPEMFKNLDNTNFIFVRFYCGYIQGLEPPWKINEKGDCDFNLKKVDKWLNNVKIVYPNIYQKIAKYFEKDTISMMDLILADKEIEPYISLVWSKNEIIQGYKDYNNIRYDFRDCMINYPRYRVMKFIYKYHDSFCLVDINFICRDNSINRESGVVESYLNDTYKKFKYLKKILASDKIPQYLQETRDLIGHITPLAAFIELTDKIKKYNVVDTEKLRKMELYAQDYAKKHNIPTIDYKELQKIISEKTAPLYEKYKEFIDEKYKLGLFVMNVRILQLNEPIKRETIQARQNNPKYDCTLFPITVDEIKIIYKKSAKILIDPINFYRCLIQVSEKLKMPIKNIIYYISQGGFYEIEYNTDKLIYTLYKVIENGKFIFKTGKNLQELQIFCLTN
jgi:hypothetical protein